MSENIDLSKDYDGKVEDHAWRTAAKIKFSSNRNNMLVNIRNDQVNVYTLTRF